MMTKPIVRRVDEEKLIEQLETYKKGGRKRKYDVVLRELEPGVWYETDIPYHALYFYAKREGVKITVRKLHGKLYFKRIS